MVYFAQAQPDFYNHKYKIDGYKHTLQMLRDFDSKKQCLYISPHGLSTAGRIYGFWQWIKPWLGFENHCNQAKINAEILKFLHYGTVKNFSEDAEIKKLYQDIYQKSQSKKLILDNSITVTLMQLRGDNPLSTKIKDLRSHLSGFCIKHRHELNPCFWSKPFSYRLQSPSHEFGTTYIKLASSLLSQDRTSIEVFDFIYRASSCNHALTATYQKELTECFNEACRYEPSMEEGFNFYKAKIRLRLSQRAFFNSNYEESITQLTSAEQIKPELKKDKHASIHAFSLIKLDKMDQAEKILSYINPKSLDSKTRHRCMEAYLILGDHAFLKKDSLKTALTSLITFGFGTTKVKLCDKALFHYQKAMQFTDSANIKKVIDKLNDVWGDAKKLKVAERSSDFLNYGLSMLKAENWQTASYLLLLALKYMDETARLLQPTGQECLEKLVEAIVKDYCESKDASKALALVDQTLELIQVKDKWISLEDVKEFSFNPDSNVVSKLPGLVDVKGNFNVYVGSDLHFLRGELLELTKGPADQKLQSYRESANLSPKNPFGSHSVYMKDDQETSSDYATYRQTAMNWGGAERLQKLGWTVSPS